MAKAGSLYRRTDNGLRAWECPDSGLPRGYRRILGFIEMPTYVEAIVAHLCDYPPKQIHDWLDELETLGFIDIYPVREPEGDALVTRQAA